MSKLTNLYYAHLKERDSDMEKYTNGSEAIKKFTEYLQTKLNAKDFLEAEALFTAAISESNEESFKDGCKYTFGLGLELSGQEEKE